MRSLNSLDIASLKLAEILSLKRDLAAEEHGPELSIAILSNIIVGQLKAILELFLHVEGVRPRVSLGEYDNILQDAHKFQNTEVLIVFWELANLVDGLQYRIEQMSDATEAALEEKVKKELGFFFELVSGIKLVLFNRFTASPFTHFFNSPQRLDRLATRLNEHLEAILPDNVVTVDLEKVFMRRSMEACIDYRYYMSSKALFTVAFFKSYVPLILPSLRKLTGKEKKVLVLDCDNTLWKGVVAEDGIDGIVVGGHRTGGIAFEEVQALCKALAKKGVVLNLCSKNNFEDIEEAFVKRTGMVLDFNDILSAKINWRDKAANIIELAEEMNLGLDSFVFLDDSDYEVNLVRAMLPEVTALKVPEKLHCYPFLLRELTTLFPDVITPEDRQRTKHYREDAQRKAELTHFVNFDAYLRSLKMQMDVAEDDTSVVERLAQLTQKTNQFNLTTKRYSQSDMKAFLDDMETLLLSFSVSDRFGDYGITGLAIVKFRQNVAEIDTFLMSCRVLGRGVEFAFYDEILGRCRLRGVKFLFATYQRTAKNSQVADFYNRCGMNELERTREKRCYKVAISARDITEPGHIEVRDKKHA